MKKFGVKLWSKDFVKNLEFAKECIANLEKGLFDYVELFALPNSFQETKEFVKEHLQGKKVVIHAPHSVFGLDTGNPERLEQNLADLKSSQEFADMLDAKIIILHTGYNEGEKFVDESVRQFKRINDSRIAVENLPSYCTATGKLLHGTSPLEIKKVIDGSGCQFCFDFAHAICAANAYGRDIWKDLSGYAALNPAMYHLSDGHFDSDKDEHLHYGEGDYDLKRLVKEFTSENAIITMETGYGVPTGAEPWVKDINYIRTLIK